MARAFALGRLLVAAAAAAATAAACGHGSGDGPDLQALRADPAGALRRARAAVARQCPSPGSPSDDCCAAMTSEGDALLAGDQRQAAHDAYEKTRNRCLLYQPVRRRLFLLRQPAGPASQRALKQEVTLNVMLELDLQDDVRLAWFATYLDGQPVPKVGNSLLAFGEHELWVELYFEPRERGALGGPTRVDVFQTVVVPRSLEGEKHLAGGVNLQVRDEGGAGTLAARIRCQPTPVPFRNLLKALARRPSQAARPAEEGAQPRRLMLAPNVALRQRITPAESALPLALQQAKFWGLFKICVSAEGQVENVTTMTTDNPALVSDLTAAIRRWTFRPFLDPGDQRPAAFCAPFRLQGPMR
jgi:hypothetical protein